MSKNRIISEATKIIDSANQIIIDANELPDDSTTTTEALSTTTTSLPELTTTTTTTTTEEPEIDSEFSSGSSGIPGDMPDFSQDPDAIVLDGDLTLSGEIRYTTIVVPSGRTLTLLPGTHLVKKDVPLDTSFDPEQFGHGILVLGTGVIESKGTPCRSYSRSVSGLSAGSELVTLQDAPDGWSVGDTIFITGTKQQRSVQNPVFKPTSEVVTIIGINGQDITFIPKLVYDHPVGPRPSMTPHVGRFDRDVKFSSENPDNPGHVMFMRDAIVDFHYTQLTDMGRTRNEVRSDLTTYNEDGTVDHLATNRIARYGLHTHLMGDSGANVHIIGNSIRNPLKWGITIHGTNFATVEDNIIYGAHGSGITGEDQSEHSNIFKRNLICNVRGDTRPDETKWIGIVPTLDRAHSPDKAYIGNGFWFAGGKANILEDNICSDCFAHAIGVSGYGGDRLDLFDQKFPFATDTIPTVPWNRNEFYGCGMGLGEVHPLGVWDRNERLPSFTMVHNDMICWHIRDRAVRINHTSATHFINCVFKNDPSVLPEGSRYETSRFVPVGFNFSNRSYTNGGHILTDCEVTGFVIGIITPVVVSLMQPTFEMIGGILNNWINIHITPSRHNPRTATYRDVDMQPNIDPAPTQHHTRPYQIFASEEQSPFTELNVQNAGKSDVQVIGWLANPVTIYIPEDPAATCTDTDDRVRGLVCED